MALHLAEGDISRVVLRVVNFGLLSLFLFNQLLFLHRLYLVLFLLHFRQLLSMHSFLLSHFCMLLNFKQLRSINLDVVHFRRFSFCFNSFDCIALFWDRILFCIFKHHFRCKAVLSCNELVCIFVFFKLHYWRLNYLFLWF